MAAALTPPRPRPALRIGVTGPQRDRAALRAVLTQISAEATAIATAFPSAYAGRPVLHYLVAAGDGGGTDDGGAADARGLGYTAVVVADRALLPADRTVLRHADVLIMGDDGGGGEARGAASELVTQARVWGVPIVRIDAHAPTPEHWLIDGAALATAAATAAGLAAVIRDALTPPVATEGDTPKRRRRRTSEGKSPIAPSLTQYLTTRPTWAVGGLFAAIVRLVTWERPRLPRVVTLGRATIERARADWHALWTRPTPVDPAIAQPVLETLSEYYIWADGLANRFATLHRDASITPYLLAFIAALLAAHLGGAVANIGPVLVAWAVFFLYRHAVRAKYHDRWIDYRSLAEQLRQLAFLWPLGRPLRAVRVRGEAGSEAPHIAWIDWYARAVAREAGLFPVALTPDHLATCRSMLIDRFIAPQYEYHRRTVQRFDTVRTRLHTVALAVFWATMILASVNLAASAVHGHGTPNLSRPSYAWWARVAAPVAILLPAIGAGIHGFLGQGDFSNLARRSKSMSQSLHTLMTSPVPTHETVDTLGDLAETAAEAMGEEVLNWRVFVRLKAPSLA